MPGQGHAEHRISSSLHPSVLLKQKPGEAPAWGTEPSDEAGSQTAPTERQRLSLLCPPGSCRSQPAGVSLPPGWRRWEPQPQALGPFSVSHVPCAQGFGGAPPEPEAVTEVSMVQRSENVGCLVPQTEGASRNPGSDSLPGAS